MHAPWLAQKRRRTQPNLPRAGREPSGACHSDVLGRALKEPHTRAARKKKAGWRDPAFFVIGGGATGDRTPDLVIANDALSQLSYGPTAARILATSQRLAKPWHTAAGAPRRQAGA